jgi:tRNA(adenine34) deaminase
VDRKVKCLFFAVQIDISDFMLTIYSDDYYMEQAIKEAIKAKDEGEIPVGAVIVCQKQIIARAHNQTQILSDVTAHAEVLAITSASSYLGSKYLKDCTLYVTLEPCIMCAGALFWSQIGKVVYGASDEKRGFMRYGKELLHPATKLEYGIRHDECAKLMIDFFERKRK